MYALCISPLIIRIAFLLALRTLKAAAGNARHRKSMAVLPATAIKLRGVVVLLGQKALSIPPPPPPVAGCFISLWRFFGILFLSSTTTCWRTST